MIILSRFQHGCKLTKKGFDLLESADLILISRPPVRMSNIHPFDTDDIKSILDSVSTPIQVVSEASNLAVLVENGRHC